MTAAAVEAPPREELTIRQPVHPARIDADRLGVEAAMVRRARDLALDSGMGEETVTTIQWACLVTVRRRA